MPDRQCEIPLREPLCRVVYFKQSERVSHSHRKRKSVTLVERINPITTKKIENRLLAEMESCFGLVSPYQHGIANT